MSEVVVSAPARLHFGMLDPLGVAARRFGGFGVGVSGPRVLVAVRRTATVDEVVASGPQAERAAIFARRARAAFGVRDSLAVEVREAIPAHSGLGSGTKLGLAIASAVATLAGVEAGPERLAMASGRGARSSVGSWTFAEPGLVVEAGVLDGADGADGAGEAISPLVARFAMPKTWRCVLALPRDAAGLSGDAEERFFGRAPAPARSEPAISRRLLTELLPGLIAQDIDEFGAALTAIQREVGELFAGPQGGVFHPRAAPLVDALARLGVGALGQSSWGPAVYGIVDGPDRAARVAEDLRTLAGATDVSVIDFDRHGATRQRTEAPA